LRAPSTLAEVRGAASVFPSDVLESCDSALMLFCAGFYGRNDCIWLQEAGLLDVVGIDLDAGKLDVMRELYPEDWRFVCVDAFVAAHVFKAGAYDLVCVDAFAGEHADRALQMLDEWTRIARRSVVLTAIGKPEHDVPSGWTSRFVHRSDHEGGCYWLVLERA
jgi:hypothetical protein